MRGRTYEPILWKSILGVFILYAYLSTKFSSFSLLILFCQRQQLLLEVGFHVLIPYTNNTEAWAECWTHAIIFRYTISFHLIIQIPAWSYHGTATFGENKICKQVLATQYVISN